MASANTLLLLCALVACMLSSTANALKVGKIPVAGVFYNPNNLKLYYYPKTQFAFAACGPRDDDLRFSIDYDTKAKAYAVALTYTPSDVAYKMQFHVIRRMHLNLKTGLLSLTTRGAAISVDLTTYFPIKGQSQPKLSHKLVLPPSDPSGDVTSDVLPEPVTDLDNAVVNALKFMAKTAKAFSAGSTVSYQCREKSTTLGSRHLANWATYLEKLAAWTMQP